MVLTEQYDEASRLFAESLQLRRQLDDRRGMWLSLSGVEKLLRATGRWAESARLSGAILDLAQRMGLTVAPEERREFETAIAILRQHLGETEFVAAWSVGTQLTLEQAVETAAELLVTFSGSIPPGGIERTGGEYKQLEKGPVAEDWTFLCAHAPFSYRKVQSPKTGPFCVRTICSASRVFRMFFGRCFARLGTFRTINRRRL